jgi:hypothetical protein
MPHFRRLIVLPLLLLYGSGCGKHDHAHDHGDGHAHTTSPAAGVQWPALDAVHHLSEKADGWVAKQDFAAMRTGAAAVAATLGKLAESPIPADVHQPLTVKELLLDAKALQESFAKAGELADEPLAVLYASFHPFAAELMEQAGMPHTHGHDHDHDHGPGEHTKP